MVHDEGGVAESIHICSTRSQSGIAAYARDFHHSVLGPENYALVDPEDILRREEPFALGTRFHVQLGVFQHRERLAMTKLMRAGHRDIDATIHDPPFLTFPYYQFRSRLLMKLSRGFDWYLGSLGHQRRALERLARAFVLSEEGRSALLRLAPRANAIAIPHLVRRDRIWPAASPLGHALIYFGFIGPNKGLDYVLELHRALRTLRPKTHLHVVGRAAGGIAERYLAKLQDEYREDTTFHGYVPDDQLDALFERAAHVILPYAPYTRVMPTSGSAIHALRRGRILWTTPVNAMSETVTNGENGFMLSMNLPDDARRLAAVLNDEALSRKISDNARQTAIRLAEYPYRQHFRRPS